MPSKHEGQRAGALAPPPVSARSRRAQDSSVTHGRLCRWSRERAAASRGLSSELLMRTPSSLLSDFVYLGVRERHQPGSQFLGRGSQDLKGSLCSFLVREREALVGVHVPTAYSELLPRDKKELLVFFLTSAFLDLTFSKFLPSHMNSLYRLGILLINSSPLDSFARGTQPCVFRGAPPHQRRPLTRPSSGPGATAALPRCLCPPLVTCHPSFLFKAELKQEITRSLAFS